MRVTRTVPVRGRAASPARSPEVVSVYDRSLRRAQLRSSVTTLLTVVAPLLALPALGVLLPRVAGFPVLGVPVSWLLLAVAVYPAIWLAGRRHVSEAERTEDDFRELLGEDRP